MQHQFYINSALPSGLGLCAHHSRVAPGHHHELQAPVLQTPLLKAPAYCRSIPFYASFSDHANKMLSSDPYRVCRIYKLVLFTSAVK